jgi:hypothetical protein
MQWNRTHCLTGRIDLTEDLRRCTYSHLLTEHETARPQPRGLYSVGTSRPKGDAVIP